MSHFNLKSLAFYGVMIGSVLILFKAVTAYGESTLTAPTNISGIYELSGSDLPDCFKGEKLNLSIEQSGIYIFATLDLVSQLPKDNHSSSTGESQESAQSKPENKAQIIHETNNLNGLMKSQPFVLAGTTSQLGGCSKISEQSPAALTLNVQFLNPSSSRQNLSGTLNWSSLSFDFVGTAQENLNSEDK